MRAAVTDPKPEWRSFFLCLHRLHRTHPSLPRGGLDQHQDGSADALGQHRPCIHDPGQIEVGLRRALALGETRGRLGVRPI